MRRQIKNALETRANTLRWRSEKPLSNAHYAVAAFLALLVVLVWVIQFRSVDLADGSGLIPFFAGLMFLSYLLLVRMPSGLYVGLPPATAISASLVIGHERAVILLLLTGLAVLPLRILGTFVSGLPYRTIRITIVELLAHSSAVPLCLLAAGLPIQLNISGSSPTLSSLSAEPLAMYIALFALALVGFALMWLSLPGIDLNRYITRYRRALVSNGLFTLALGPLLAITVIVWMENLPLIGGLYTLLIFMVSGFNRTQVKLSQRIEELQALNHLGTALNDQHDIKGLGHVIQSEIDTIIDASNFFMALHDDFNDSISFPVALRRREVIPVEDRAFGNGLAEAVIRSGKSLMMNRRANELARERDIEPIPAPNYDVRDWFSFLGVPLIVNEKAVGMLALGNHDPGYIFTEDDRELMEAIATKVSSALHNVRLLTQTRQQKAELTSLNEVSILVGASLELDRVISTICRIMIDLLDAQKAAVFLRQDTDSMYLVGHAGMTEQFVVESSDVFLNTLRGEAARTGNVVAIENVDTYPLPADTFIDAGVKAIIDVPLISEGQLIGSLAAYYTHPHRFTPHETELIRTIAGQMAIAVKNARLFEDTRERKREIEALYKASTRLTTSLSIESVLQATVSSVIEALEADSCGAYLIGDAGDEYRSAVWMRLDNGTVEDVTGLNHTLTASSLPSIHNAIVEDDHVYIRKGEKSLSAAEHELLTRVKVASLLVIPLTVNQTPLGAIFIGNNDTAHSFAEEQIKQTKLLLNQSAVALQNAHLFETIDVALSSRIGELEALEDISQQMTSQLDLDQVIKHVAEAASKATQADICEVILLDEVTNTLSVVQQYNKIDSPGAASWPASDGLTGRALRKGEAVVSGNLKKEEDVINLRPEINSELAAPIILDGRRLGVINVESRRFDAFDYGHVRFVSNLAKHAAVAIKNARLFETIQRQAQEFHTLRDLGVELLSSDTLESTLHIIIREALERLGAKDVHIYLYDAETDKVSYGANILDTGEIDARAFFPGASRLTRVVTHSGKRIVIHDVHTHALFTDVLDTLDHKDVRRVVGVPLKRGDEVIGVFIAVLGSKSTLETEKLAYLDLLASQAAVAIATEQLAEETRESRDQLQAILQSSNDGIMMLDSQGKLIIANSRLEYLINVHLNNHIGQTFDQIVQELRNQHGQEGFPALAESREIYRTALDNPNLITRRSYALKGPPFRALQEISSPVVGENGEALGRLFVIRDVTQEYELEMYRREMSGMIVHDLRAPLSSVISGLHYALDESHVEPERFSLDIIQQTLEIGLRSSNSMLNMIEELLNIHRLESGEISLAYEEHNLAELARQLLAANQARAEEVNITMAVVAPDDLPTIGIDIFHIERVFNNILDNALRYTPDGGQISVEVVSTETHQEVIISDTGDGIPVELREKIFGRFHQENLGRHRRGSKGSGIGLTFCQLAVESHGGRIWVDDAPGGGAAFHFTLPRGMSSSLSFSDPPNADASE